MAETELTKRILQKHKYLLEKRLPWESLWQDIADYIIPHRIDIKGTAQDGDRQDRRIYNGTAIEALNLFADGMHGYMISPSLKWFALRMADRTLRDNPEAKKWTEEVQEQMYFALARSNFYHEMRMYLEDGGSIGTAVEYMEEDVGKGRIVFNTIPAGEYCIEENKYREVDTVYRRYKKTAKTLVEMFGIGKLPDKVKKAYEQNPYTDFYVIHAVEPRESRDTGKLDGANKPFSSVWILEEGGHLLRNSGYDENPYAVWRYKKSGNERYGRSPASSALAEIISLNLISKDLLTASELFINPPVNVPAKQASSYDINPGGVNFYSDPNKIISRVNIEGNYPIGIDRENKIEHIINAHFKVDFFLMLAQAERQMTATEIIEKQGEKAALLGAAIGRLNSEALDPIIDRVFNIELKAGRLPEAPEILLANGGEIDVVYQGPLAQAQRRLFQTQGISRGLEVILPLAQYRPEIMDMYDWDEITLELGDAYGMPEKVKNAPNVVAGIRQGKMQMAQMGQQKADMMNGSAAMKDLSVADKNTGGRLSEQLAAAVPQQA